MSSMDAVPDILLRSPLMRNGGYLVFDELIDRATWARLAAEAQGLAATAVAHLVTEPDREELRGGQPQRKFASAEGGPVQDAVYTSPALAGHLLAWAGAHFAPTGRRGSFTYYRRPGDHLALHRDVRTCDLAMITVLDRRGGDGRSGTLTVYPRRLGDTLSEIRRTPRRGGEPVDLAAGQSVLLFGGLVPHCVTATAPGQSRTVSLLCFRLVSPG